MKGLLFLLFFTLSVNFSGNNIVSNTDVTNVFICNSQNAKKYHYSKSCRGLNACKAEIKEITLERAKKIGKTICGWED